MVTVLLALLSAILYSVISGILRSRDISRSIVGVDRTAHVILTRLTTELSGRSLMIPVRSKDGGGSSLEEDPSPSPTPGGAFAISGSAQYFLGRDARDGEYDRDSLRFVTHSGGLAPTGTYANYGPLEIQYRLELDPELDGEESDRTMERGFADSSTSLTLVREEFPAAVTDEEVLKQRRFATPIAEGILSLNFRYQRDGKWLDGWRDQSPPLPEAIEITIGLKAEGEKVEYFRTAIAISPRGRAAASASS